MFNLNLTLHLQWSWKFRKVVDIHDLFEYITNKQRVTELTFPVIFSLEISNELSLLDISKEA